VTEYRGGRTVQSAHTTIAAKPTKKMPERTLAALAERTVRATNGYARSTGTPA
jgi:hypothetical protein